MLIDCNCIEDLGCFIPDPGFLPEEQVIKFGIAAFCSGDYQFIVYYRGRVEVVEVFVLQDDEFELPNTFDESAELYIKIKIPEDCKPASESCLNSGINFITSPSGACVWKIKNTGSSC